MQANYDNGRINGKVTSFYDIGTVESEKYYVNGIPHGNFTFYEKRAGQVKQIIKFKKGVKISEEDN